MSLISLIIFIPLAIIIFLSVIFAGWWLYKKSRSTSATQDELQRPVIWTQTRALWSSGLLAGLTSIAGIIIVGLAIEGIFFMLPTPQDPGSASGIGMLIGIPFLCFGGVWIIASSIFGVWLHRRFAGTTSITMGLLIGVINGGFVGIVSIIYSSLVGGFSMSDILYKLVTSVFDVLILLFPSVIGGFLGGALFNRNAEKAIL